MASRCRTVPLVLPQSKAELTSSLPPTTNLVGRRRQRELVEFLQRLKRLIRPYLARQKELLRQRAAMRLVHFLQVGQGAGLVLMLLLAQ